MALAILDGTQTATTLSTILSSGQHITAHTVVSLGAQAITDILNATSAGLTNTQLRASVVTIGGTVTIGAGTAQIGSVTASISGTVPVSGTFFQGTQPVSLATVPTHGVTLASTTVTVSALPRPTWTNYSGTITTANTAITAISTTTRSYLLAQVTTGQMFINIGATATSMNSVYFSAGQGFAWETSVPQGIVSIISTVTGTNYVLKEG